MPGSTTSFLLRFVTLQAARRPPAMRELDLAPGGQGITLTTGAGVTGSLSSVATSIAQASASCNEDGAWEGFWNPAVHKWASLMRPYAFQQRRGASLITIGFGVEFADQPIAIADFAPCVEDMGGRPLHVDSVVDPMEPVVLKGDESFDQWAAT